MIHPTAIIHPNTYVSTLATVEAYCILGSDHGHLSIGPDAVIRSHTVIEGGSEIGWGLETGHHVLIRAGNKIGKNLRIGTGSSLEGGATIGDYVRIHGRCEMTKANIHDFARIYANCYITDNRLPPSNVNEPVVMESGAVLTIGCVVVAGVKLGYGSFVGANTTVVKDVPAGHALVNGKIKPVTELTWKGYSYPWTGYYRDGYPEEAWDRLYRLHDRIMEAAGDGD